MVNAVWEYGILFYVIGVMCILGVFSKLIVQFTLRRLVREAGRMGKSLHPLMKLVRAKFEHTCMISDKVQNVRAFVDKYMFEYKVLGIKLHSWRQIEKASAWASLIIGGIGAARGYFENAGLETIGQYAVAGAAGAVLLFALRMVTDEGYQLEAAKNYMVDFLENTYARRYERINQRQEQETAEEKSVGEELQAVKEAVEEELPKEEIFADPQPEIVLEETVQEQPKMKYTKKQQKGRQKEVQKETQKEEVESELISLMKEEEKKQEKTKQSEEKKRDEQMIREILAEFLA
ncbi:hypothetical protein [Sellimonas caecigallum]|uniref:Uncharacterized protein n=1 Tax=Sellimonas caecigallum TaxID=2592333 RepID=A0ABS7L6T6_9FIRM|nr:hypothetical protein [Sellimonas caecigallum]MBY0758783.1 hypothetical protein [Sellimonas caecigallum]OUO98270.1 hypothetical protein B5F37_14565 [Drancourtella sp. An210]